MEVIRFMADIKLVQQYSHLCEKENGVSVLPPKTEKMVRLVDLMTREDVENFKNMASMFVSVDEKIYSANPRVMVPSHAKIIRDSSQRLVGLAAVSGG
jgi:hypothetical protein